jgi:hypothetical protein
LVRRSKGKGSVNTRIKWSTRVERWRQSGGDLHVDAEVIFDRGDTDFELEALVDFVLLELGQLRVDAVNFCIELVDAAVEARFRRGEVVLGGA